MIYCRYCANQAAERLFSETYARCLHCGSDTNLIFPNPSQPGPWLDPFEKKSDCYDATSGWGAMGYFATNAGRQYETVIAAGLLDRTPGWRQLLVELTKTTVKNGFLHLECARPILDPQPQFAQVISPIAMQTEFKPLGLAIINWRFDPARQAYWLQKMDEVFRV